MLVFFAIWFKWSSQLVERCLEDKCVDIDIDEDPDKAASVAKGVDGSTDQCFRLRYELAVLLCESSPLHC